MSEKKLKDSDYLRLTIPFMLSTMTQPLMGAVNTAVMGQMPDPKYIAAVAVGVMLFDSVYWMFTFLRVSTTGYAAQAHGAHDDYLGMTAFMRPAIIALIAGSLCLIFQKPLIDVYLSFINPAPDVAELCRVYFHNLVWGAPFVLFNYVALGWLMGQMRVQATVFMQVSMNLLNMVLSILFVSVFGWGVPGVAWATLICQVYGGILGGILMRRYGKFNWKRLPWGELLDLGEFGSMLKVNANLMIRTVCLMGMNNAVAAYGASFGTTVLAANAVLLQIRSLMSYLIDGMANGASIFSGRAFGQKNLPLMESTVRVTLKWMFIVSALLSAIYYVGIDLFVHIFTENEDVVETAMVYYLYIVLYMMLTGVGQVLYGVFSGATQTAPIRNMMIIALVTFLVVSHFAVPALGNHGVWLAWNSFYISQSVVLPLYMGRIRRAIGTGRVH